MKIINSINCKALLSLFVFGICFFNGEITYAFQQDSTSNKQAIIDSANKIEISSDVREELHRYIGYEELLPRYLSLPYDIIMNTNIAGPFIDIGFFFLLFFPIFLLLGLKNKLLKVLTALLMILFLIISVPTGYRSNKILAVNQVETAVAIELSQITFIEAPAIYLKLHLTRLANSIYQPIHVNIIQVYSGEGDAITYAIVFLLFLLIFFLLTNRLKNASMGKQMLSYFFLMYGFLWLLLGTGVTWYGIFMLPLGLILIGIGALKTNQSSKFLKYTFLTLSTLWIISSTAYRFANYPLPLSPKKISEGFDQAKYNTSAIHQGPLMYGLGIADKSRLMELLFPQYEPVLRRINSNPEAKIYRIGTYFNYFIDRNNERVFQDNQLTNLDRYIKRFPNDKLRAVEAMKKNGYKYIILDMHVASIDRTPDASLRKKARDLGLFLVNNSGLKPIGTDRVVINREGQRVYGLSGQEIIHKGTFIVYELQ